MNGFTPGPWEAVGLMVIAGRETVVHTGISNSFSPPRPHECAANARLIAVAPELYQTLDRMVSHYFGVAAGPGTNDLIRHAQAVLAKGCRRTMITPPRYTAKFWPAHVPEQRWVAFDTFSQEPVEGEAFAAKLTADRAAERLNRNYEASRPTQDVAE